MLPPFIMPIFLDAGGWVCGQGRLVLVHWAQKCRRGAWFPALVTVMWTRRLVPYPLKTVPVPASSSVHIELDLCLHENVDKRISLIHKYQTSCYKQLYAREHPLLNFVEFYDKMKKTFLILIVLIYKEIVVV